MKKRVGPAARAFLGLQAWIGIFGYTYRDFANAGSLGTLLSMEEVGCPELGIGKASVVIGYWDLGLQIPH